MLSWDKKCFYNITLLFRTKHEKSIRLCVSLPVRITIQTFWKLQGNGCDLYAMVVTDLDIYRDSILFAKAMSYFDGGIQFSLHH